MDATDATEARFTVRDYERLPDELRCQLIAGSLVKEPSPSYRHQSALSRLHHLLAGRIGPDRVVPSPLDVVIDEFTVLQPDLAIWTDAPDRAVRRVPIPTIVVELLSPATERRDREQKTPLYLAGGVAEVWLIDPETGSVEVHTPAGVATHAADELVTSAAVPAVAVRGRDLLR